MVIYLCLEKNELYLDIYKNLKFMCMRVFCICYGDVICEVENVGWLYGLKIG